MVTITFNGVIIGARNPHCWSRAKLLPSIIKKGLQVTDTWSCWSRSSQKLITSTEEQQQQQMGQLQRKVMPKIISHSSQLHILLFFPCHWITRNVDLLVAGPGCLLAQFSIRDNYRMLFQALDAICTKWWSISESQNIPCLAHLFSLPPPRCLISLGY